MGSLGSLAASQGAAVFVAFILGYVLVEVVKAKFVKSPPPQPQPIYCPGSDKVVAALERISEIQKETLELVKDVHLEVEANRRASMRLRSISE